MNLWAPKGIIKGLHRILRCNPLGSSGYDPVKNNMENQKNLFLAIVISMAIIFGFQLLVPQPERSLFRKIKMLNKVLLISTYKIQILKLLLTEMKL